MIKSNWIAGNFLLILLSVISGVLATPPNFVIILTDDQDLILKSLHYLPKIDKLLVKKGATFSHAVEQDF